MKYVFAFMMLAGVAQANVTSYNPNTGIYTIDQYGNVD